jgi:hypothetical protein
MRAAIAIVLSLLAACGAAQKVEAAGDQADHAVDRDSKKLEREVDFLVHGEAGADAADAR